MFYARAPSRGMGQYYTVLYRRLVQDVLIGGLPMPT